MCIDGRRCRRGGKTKKKPNQKLTFIKRARRKAKNRINKEWAKVGGGDKK